MLNYDCFEIAMLGDSKKSVQVRYYFVELRNFIYENHHIIFSTIEQQRFIEKI